MIDPDSADGFARLLCAVDSVLREHLDRIDVHVCDEHNDEIKAKGLSPELRALYEARKHIQEVSDEQEDNIVQGRFDYPNSL